MALAGSTLAAARLFAPGDPPLAQRGAAPPCLHRAAMRSFKPHREEFEKGRTPMVRMFARLALALFALSLPLAVQAKTLYWISHGSPADPVWTYFLAGANMWAKDTGQTVKTSFHNGDVPSQQEAIRTAIAAKADAIVTTSPDPGSLVDVVKEARAAGIPVINFNTPDAKVNFNAYVGVDLAVV